MLVQQTSRRSCLSSGRASSKAVTAVRPATRSRRSAVITRAGYDTNIFLNLVTSTACGAMAAAVTLITAEDTDKEVGVMAGGQGKGVGAEWDATQVDVEHDGAIALVSVGLLLPA